jgi:hypothetical protein
MKPCLIARSLLLSLTLFVNFAGFSQDSPKTFLIADVCLSPTEKILADLINEYRKEKGLPEVTISLSLTYVAQVHARDLMLHYKQNSRCNMHSWSENGAWTSCCYTPDHRNASCMWNKPRELTKYPGDGYEIAFFSNYPYSTPGGFASDILKGWKKSKGHNEIIVNKGKWNKSTWKALGIGVYGNYAVVWFGELNDDTGKPPVCSEQ